MFAGTTMLLAVAAEAAAEAAQSGALPPEISWLAAAQFAPLPAAAFLARGDVSDVAFRHVEDRAAARRRGDRRTSRPDQAGPRIPQPASRQRPTRRSPTTRRRSRMLVPMPRALPRTRAKSLRLRRKLSVIASTSRLQRSCMKPMGVSPRRNPRLCRPSATSRWKPRGPSSKSSSGTTFRPTM